MSGRHKQSRRQFLSATIGGAAAFHIVPQSAFGANERLNVACIGIGGKGRSDVEGVASAGANIVALCDVDDNRRVKRGKDPRQLYPKAGFYRDYRRMIEKERKSIDAVTVSTPDHTHCHAAVTAMRAGKHVYCQKPLTHSIFEARLMAKTAKEFRVATQMGNQAHAGEPIRRAVELIRAGIIGKVREVHAWTNRPIWPQGMTRLPAAMPVPKGLAWDLWLGPAPQRPYNEAYCPFRWRGWWDFGTGALGDMGCHIMDMPYWSLDLKHPLRVSATSKGNTEFAGPTAAKVTYEFAAGKYNHDLKFMWYERDNRPERHVVAEAGISTNNVLKTFDLVMIGDKGKFFFNRGRTNWLVTPEERVEQFKAVEKTIPRVENEDVEWVTACKGGDAALSNFSLSGPFTEVVLLGNLAIRLGKTIEWDGPAMKARNCPEADALIKREYRKGWQL